MGLNLPSEVSYLLNELGFIWPESDEEALFRLGRAWLDFAGTVGQLNADAAAAVARIAADNHGDAVQAFLADWRSEDAPPAVLDSGVQGAQVVGAALILCAVVVLALKINVIVQLVVLLVEIIQAIATAPETFGVSLLEIPVFKKITGMIINFLVGQAVEAVLG